MEAALDADILRTSSSFQQKVVCVIVSSDTDTFEVSLPTSACIHDVVAQAVGSSLPAALLIVFGGGVVEYGETASDWGIEEGARLSCQAPSTPRWLVNDKTWARQGPCWAEGVSSVINDQWGTPATVGVASMLGDGSWTCLNGQTRNQWMMFDLHSPRTVTALRLRGSNWHTSKNAKEMVREAIPKHKGDNMPPPRGPLACGKFEPVVVASFTGKQSYETMPPGMPDEEYDDWLVVEHPPTTSRWWRLRLDANWGAHDYLHLLGLNIQALP